MIPKLHFPLQIVSHLNSRYSAKHNTMSLFSVFSTRVASAWFCVTTNNNRKVKAIKRFHFFFLWFALFKSSPPGILILSVESKFHSNQSYLLMTLKQFHQICFLLRKHQKFFYLRICRTRFYQYFMFFYRYH
jgi:hypothetical protein